MFLCKPGQQGFFLHRIGIERQPLKILIGNFVAAAGGTADGFDKLGVYGRTSFSTARPWRWLIDTDNDGVPNINVAEPRNINGLPVAGNFDNDANNGDEVALFDGTAFWLDADHNFQVDKQIVSPLRGFPIVGDFDGDGRDDLGAWSDDRFMFDLADDGRWGVAVPCAPPIAAGPVPTGACGSAAAG